MSAAGVDISSEMDAIIPDVNSPKQKKAKAPKKPRAPKKAKVLAEDLPSDESKSEGANDGEEKPKKKRKRGATKAEVLAKLKETEEQCQNLQKDNGELLKKNNELAYGVGQARERNTLFQARIQELTEVNKQLQMICKRNEWAKGQE
jgi:hypothetical protein